MADWFDKYSIDEGKPVPVPGTVVTEPAKKDWFDKYAVDMSPAPDKPRSKKYFDPQTMFPGTPEEGVGTRFMRGMFGPGSHGVPVVGKMLPELTAEQKAFEDRNPIKTGVMKALTGAAATAPLSIPSFSFGPWANIAGQGLMSGGISVADKLAEKGTDATAGELTDTGVKGTLFGALGQGANRLVAPFHNIPTLKDNPAFEKAFNINPSSIPGRGQGMFKMPPTADEVKNMMGKINSMDRTAAANVKIDKWHGRIDTMSDFFSGHPMGKYLLPVLGGAHGFTGGGMTTAILEAMAAGAAPYALKGLAANKIGPNTETILNALAKSAATQ